MFYILIILLLVIVIGLFYKTKRENFAVQYAGRNKCGELDAGPMDRPKYQPGCFYYNIDRQNEALYNNLRRISNNLDKEIHRAKNIDLRLTGLSQQGINSFDQLMNGPIVQGVKDNLSGGSTLLQNQGRVGVVDPSIGNVYNIDEQKVEDEVRQVLHDYIGNVLDNALTNSNINFNDEVQKVITEEVKAKVANPITTLFVNKFNKSANKDIIGIVKSILDSIDVKSSIDTYIQLAINNDKQIKAYIAAANKDNIQLGDFVYFRYKLSNPQPTICADGIDQMEIIAGGRVCDIDPVQRTAKISYNFVMNPNQTPRCNGLNSTSPDIIDYSQGPDGFPRWYPMSLTQTDCAINAPNNLACKPSQWSDSADSWVADWIGGFDRSKDQMLCGISPKQYNLPDTIPIALLNKNLNRLIANCSQELKIVTQTNQPKISNTTGTSNTFKPPPMQDNRCPDRCLRYWQDNNKQGREIRLENGNRYYIRDDKFWKNDNSYTMPPGVIPAYVFRRAKNNTIFIYGSDNQYYKLTSSGIIPMDDTDLDEFDGNPDTNNCCIPKKQ